MIANYTLRVTFYNLPCSYNPIDMVNIMKETINDWFPSIGQWTKKWGPKFESSTIPSPLPTWECSISLQDMVQLMHKMFQMILMVGSTPIPSCHLGIK